MKRNNKYQFYTPLWGAGGLLLAILSLSFFAEAQNNWLWAKSAEYSYGTERGNSISTDGSGNSYVTGFFEGDSITFGSTTLYNVVPGGSSPDVFIVKYDSAGNVVWAESAGSSGSVIGNGITTDGSGNSYITGSFEGSITFGSTTLSSAGIKNIFIAKYDTDGNAMWAKSAGGSDIDVGKSIKVDGSGNSYVTGYFGSSSITFDSITLTGGGEIADVFIVKYDTEGNVIWAKSAGNTGEGEAGYSISVDGNGNSYVTGYFDSFTIAFGSDIITNSDMSGENTADIFIVKYDTDGNVLWAKSAGGEGDDFGNSICADTDGNSYITGISRSSSITFGSITLTNAGGPDVFTVKYDPDGNELWAKNVGTSYYNQEGNSISLDANGDCYVTGYFSESIIFGTITLNSVGHEDIFIVKYDTDGNAVWAKRAGGSSSGDYGNAVSLDGNGNIYITGYFSSSTIYFGSISLTRVGGADIFIAKLGNNIVGIEEEVADKKFLIYPNPSTGKFQLSVSGEQGGGKTVSVTNAMGEIIYNSAIADTQAIIDLSTEAKGIYFCRIENEREILKTLKIIIE